MSVLVEFVDPLDSDVVLLLDNNTSISGVPTTKDGVSGIGFSIPAGSPNGNGARLTISHAGKVTTDNHGILWLTEPYARLDIDVFFLQNSNSKPQVQANERLNNNGWEIYGSSGLRYVHCQATNYLLYQKSLLGQDISNLLYLGFSGYNVTFTMQVVPAQVGLPALIPDNYPAYFAHIPDFVQYFLDNNLRLECTLLCDMNQLGKDHAWQIDFTNKMYDLLRPFPNVMVQLANEPEANGVDAGSFVQPQGIFWSRGSSLSGGPCPLPAGNYSTAHLGRSPGGDYLDAQPYYMIQGYTGYAGTNGSVITNETRGASNTEESQRRTMNPEYFRRIAAASYGWSGMTFHSDYGIHSDIFIPGTPQDACRIAFLDGLNRG